MKKISDNKMANIGFILNWQSDNAAHNEHYFAQKVCFWRDFFSNDPFHGLKDVPPGSEIQLTFNNGNFVPSYDERKFLTIKSSQFNRHHIPQSVTTPRKGRFYPQGMIKDIHGIYKENIIPFRCVDLDDRTINVDLNHPLSQKNITLRARVHDTWKKSAERGGRCTDWSEIILRGPGMEARYKGEPTDFFSENPFKRQDEREDIQFYEKARLINHLDSSAIEVIRCLYGGLLSSGMTVLDLMGSWRSHISDNIELTALLGLGLNKEELKKNRKLTDYVIHDLNKNPHLPFDNNYFDAVICTSSVEYVTRPFEVFNDVARILKPGGLFILTFSHRWFPPKVIRLWQELHEFERMGLVLEYFLHSGQFTNLNTYSMRGLPRPYDDKYFPQLIFSDPVYAVWGQKI
jgi:SAM-dependent methyltransferase